MYIYIYIYTHIYIHTTDLRIAEIELFFSPKTNGAHWQSLHRDPCNTTTKGRHNRLLFQKCKPFSPKKARTFSHKKTWHCREPTHSQCTGTNAMWYQKGSWHCRETTHTFPRKPWHCREPIHSHTIVTNTMWNQRGVDIAGSPLKIFQKKVDTAGSPLTFTQQGPTQCGNKGKLTL